MKYLILDKTYKRGDAGGKVRLIQEWLCLHGFSVAIDGDYGPATVLAVKQFQRKEALFADGIVGNNTFTMLIRPMTRALEQIQVIKGHTTLGSLVVAYAMQHLQQHPREVGGQNMGPWVRYYMREHQGKDFAWCSGFACTVLQQACDALGIPMPVAYTMSCDELAISAKKAGLFRSEITEVGQVVPAIGSFFLCRRIPGDWTHVGIVIQTQSDAEAFSTIEGNTNDSGEREGYEVCERARGYAKKDFIVW